MSAGASGSRGDVSGCSAVMPLSTTILLSTTALVVGLSMFVAPERVVDHIFRCQDLEKVNQLELTLARLTGGLFVSQAACCLSLVAGQVSLLIFTKQHNLEPNEVDKCRSSLLCQAVMGIILVLIGLVDDRVASEAEDGDTCSEFKSAWLIGGGALYIVLGCAGIMFTFWSSEESDDQVDSSDAPPHRRLTSDSDHEHTVPLLSSQDSALEEQTEADEEEPLVTQQEGDVSTTATSRITGTRRLLKLAAPQVFYLYVGCSVLLLRLPFSLSIPHFVSTTLGALGRGDFSTARMEILLLFILGTIDAALDFWCVFLFGFAKEKIVKGVRIDTFAAILRQEVAFFDKHTSGDLSSRLNSDCGEMAGDLTWFFRFSIESVVRISGITIYMLIRCPLLGACALSIVPVVAVVNKKYGDWLQKNAMAVQNALAMANAVAQEAFSCVRTVIGFASERFEYNKYCQKIERQYRLNVKQLYMTGVYYMVISTFLINTCVQAALLLIGTNLIQRGKLTPEVLLAFMLYQGQLQNETLNLFQSYSSLIKSSGAGDKVFALLDRTPPPPGTGNPTVQTGEEDNQVSCMGSSTPSNVQLRDVDFFYPSRPTHRVLKGLSLDIPAGSTVALVGSSGCGKSTVIGLLQRLYDPSAGGVFIDGSDLRALDIKAHRRHISTVSQDPVLFSGTILSNISYGIPDATRDEVIRAAALANADTFISNFPEGYETEVGERGIQLSGGQKQRIAIARAIIKNPSLLLLDEATSALDAESEHVVQEALDHLLNINKDMTTVVVAHRLRTVRGANCIAFIEDGCVVEKGTHEELMDLADGRYRKMVARAGSNGLLPDS